MNIPFRLNLEQQKKRAKELLKGFKYHQAEALERFQQYHPKLVFQEQSSDEFEAKLADAQLVIARELGCKSWNQLRQHIGLMDSLRGQIEQADSVSDESDSCLHIRCGSDIQRALPEAGFKGDFLEFSDPFCVGPVSYDYQPEQRAEFLYNSYGKPLELKYSEMLADLKQAYQRLRNCAEQYDHVVLWFEHDSYDQFILIFLLSQFHRHGLPQQLSMVTTNQFPGSVRFLGLGQLPPEGLRLLWQTRQLVTVEQCREADQHWRAFTDPDVKVFHRYISELTNSRLPYFRNAALRQIQEMPVQEGELSLTQQLTLELLSESSPQPAGRLFRNLMEQKEPLPFLGDLMYWYILLQMKEGGLIRFIDEPDHWPQTLIALP